MSVFRIRVIVDSLKSTKDFFDTFLAIPPADLVTLPSTHWALLGYSILLAATMSLSTQTPGWNIKMACSVIKLDTYIDAMSVHVQDLSSIHSLETSKNWYRTLLTRWTAIKASYLAALQQAQPATTNTMAPTPAPEAQLAPYQVIQRMDVRDLQSETRPLPMADGFLNPGGGLELFDFAASVGSWMASDFDFPWLGVAGF